MNKQLACFINIKHQMHITTAVINFFSGTSPKLLEGQGWIWIFWRARNIEQYPNEQLNQIKAIIKNVDINFGEPHTFLG